MIKRLVWLVIGFVLGLGSSWAVTRRLRRLAAHEHQLGLDEVRQSLL